MISAKLRAPASDRIPSRSLQYSTRVVIFDHVDEKRIMRVFWYRLLNCDARFCHTGRSADFGVASHVNRGRLCCSADATAIPVTPSPLRYPISGCVTK